MTISIRPATKADAGRLAELHATRITEGFLPTLGTAFLRRLYTRIATSPRAFAIVAVDGGDVVGFAAAATDVRALYREFLVHDGLVAGIQSAPRLARSWRHVVETLRYPSSGETNGATALPAAEILAVAVAADAGGQGLGRRLVGAATTELARRGITAAKVVAGAGNEPALRMYRGCGVAARQRIAVHDGAPSEVLVWPSS
jgi:ribosomal protein S18 acetylase RimI-like enzyme